MGCTLFWVKFGNAFPYFVPFRLLARWRYYPIQISILIERPYCTLLFLAGKRKYIFAQESFYLQGILDEINE